jgi:hypothetical protein
MSTGIIAAIVVAVVVVAALVIGALTVMRRRRLQRRFGPEYDRVVGERDSKLKAEGELAERERRVRGLDTHPLTGRGPRRLRRSVGSYPGAVRRRAGGRCRRLAIARRRCDD